VSAEVTQWIDPTGIVTTLDVDWDASGRFMPDIQHEEDGIPGQPGARHRASRHKTHDFTLKITVAAADEPSLRTALRQLVRSMDPARGEGIVRVQSPIGDVREIACYYTSGLGMDENPGNSGPNMQQAKVTFRAYDPYWRNVSDTSQSFTIGAVPSFFPFFPLRLTASQIAVDTTVANAGDVEAWPVWTIKGPGSGIVLRNLTTGQNLIFSTTALGTGESITIDTRPGQKTVLKNTGANLFPDLDITSAVWSLASGSNAVRLEMASAVAGKSALQLNYRPRYLAP
jgi:phage-related protein